MQNGSFTANIHENVETMAPAAVYFLTAGADADADADANSNSNANEASEIRTTNKREHVCSPL